MTDEEPRYRVVVSGPRDTLWWLQAQSWAAEQPGLVPAAMRDLLDGQVRTDVLSHADAVAMREWAKEATGWEEETGLVLLRHPDQTTVEWDSL